VFICRTKRLNNLFDTNTFRERDEKEQKEKSSSPMERLVGLLNP